MSEEAQAPEIMFVTIRMPVELVNQIDELAIEAMRSRSAQVMFMLRQCLEKGLCNVQSS